MSKALVLFGLVLAQPSAPPPYQIAGAYWTPPPSAAQYTINGPVMQPERAMFVIAAAVPTN